MPSALDYSATIRKDHTLSDLQLAESHTHLTSQRLKHGSGGWHKGGVERPQVAVTDYNLVSYGEERGPVLGSLNKGTNPLQERFVLIN